MGEKIGRGLSIIKRCSAYLTPHSKKQVLQALVLSYLDYCPVLGLSAARKDLVKLQLAQNRAARLALHCWYKYYASSLPWLRVEERLTASLLLFVRNINVLKIPNCLHSQFTALTHTLTPQEGLFTQSPNPEQIQESVEYYIEPLLHGTPFHLILLK